MIILMAIYPVLSKLAAIDAHSSGTFKSLGVRDVSQRFKIIPYYEVWN